MTIVAGVLALADAVKDGFGAAHGGWLFAALALHISGQVSRSLAWRGVLGASWPHVSRARVCAWYVCGAGLGGVLSGRGGDAVRVALAKRDLDDASWSALGGTLVAEASFEAPCSLALTLVALSLGVGTAHLPSPLLVAGLGAALVVAAVLAARCARVRRVAREVGRG